MGSIITLTTDFGLNSAYVAAMKGVILGINPDVKLVDISHSIEPQNVLAAAFTISTVYEFFPPKTIHLVVVDPGVGTNRKAVILRTPHADFVAPDNGVLSYVLQRYKTSSGKDSPNRVRLSSGIEAFHLTRSEFWRAPVSPTFHGRDIFAPITARLSLSHQPSEFGEKTASITVLPLPRPRVIPDGKLIGHIIHVDNFGNLITDVTRDDLPDGDTMPTITINGHIVNGLVTTYDEGKGLMALIGSSGRLEIALKNGSAAVFLNARVGDEVIIGRPA